LNLAGIKKYAIIKLAMSKSPYPTKQTKELLKAILALKNEKEATAFFRDLLTLPEISDFTQRFQIAKLLYQGNSYAKIARKLKASTTTVSRVAHWLFHGRSGYQLILKRLFSKKGNLKNKNKSSSSSSGMNINLY